MQRIIFLIFVLCLFSCGDNEEYENNIVEKDSVEVIDEVKNISYEVLQSENIEEANKILIVAIDPHGNGKLAVSKFQKVVESYSCTVIGLNNVENGQQDFMSRIKNDIDDATVDLGIYFEYVFLVGFSGGAKMAFYYAIENQADGVLMCGATVPEIWSDYDFPLAMIVGTEDFNFHSFYYSPATNASKKSDFLSFVFEGKHEWPAENEILNAITFLFAQNNFRVNKIDNTFEIAKYLDENKNYLAYKLLEADFKTFEIEERKKAIVKLEQKESFKSYMQNYEQILNAGIRRNGDYIKKLPSHNIAWWTTEIIK